MTFPINLKFDKLYKYAFRKCRNVKHPVMCGPSAQEFSKSKSSTQLVPSGRIFFKTRDLEKGPAAIFQPMHHPAQIAQSREVQTSSLFIFVLCKHILSFFLKK